MKKNNKSNIAWTAALAFSLGLAFWASMPVSDTGSSKVSVISIKEPSISSIELAGGDTVVSASRGEGSNDQWWISYQRKSAPSVDGKPQENVARERFKASARFKDFLAQFAPLQAIRVIGHVADDKLSEFGLKDSSKTLVMSDAAGTVLLKLMLGKQLYGSRSLYVLNSADSKVLLLGADLINDFEKPELRFFERAITSIELEEIQAATLTQGAKTKRFGHTTKDAKGTLVWTVEGSGASPVPQASAWFDRLMQLKAASYALKEEEEALAKIPALFEVRLEGAGSANEVLQVKRRLGSSGAEYWVQSSYLSWHVKVSATRAETLEKDVPQLLND